MTFKKVSFPAPFKQYEELKKSISGIRKLITKYRTYARKSKNPDYIIQQEHRIEKLSLILADLNWIIQTQ